MRTSFKNFKDAREYFSTLQPEALEKVETFNVINSIVQTLLKMNFVPQDEMSFWLNLQLDSALKSKIIFQFEIGPENFWKLYQKLLETINYFLFSEIIYRCAKPKQLKLDQLAFLFGESLINYGVGHNRQMMRKCGKELLKRGCADADVDTLSQLLTVTVLFISLKLPRTIFEMAASAAEKLGWEKFGLVHLKVIMDFCDYCQDIPVVKKVHKAVSGVYFKKNIMFN